MVEPLTVRLFVSTQTYDIPCDPRQPAKWLLQQAKNIQRSNQSSHRVKNEIQDELEVLYNRTRRVVIELDEPIGRSVSPMDVIDARSLRQTPDTTNTSALFPWLRSHPGGPKVNDENLNSANGLFFQQLYAYTLIGRRTPETATQRREKQKREDFLDLLKLYVVGAFKDEPHVEGTHNGYHPSKVQQQPTYYTRPSTPPAPPANTTPARRASDFPTSKGFFSSSKTPTPAPVQRQIEYPPDHDSDSGSDHADEIVTRLSSVGLGADSTPARGRNSLPPPSPSPSMASLAATTPVRRVTLDQAGNPLDEMENIFDVVFKQQSIGMKLGSDESKQYAVVKECFDGGEAKKHPEIQNGVVILAVNGQEVSGLGLSRVLYRLREAPRPVVVRFGRIATDHHARTGTWG